MSVPCCSFDSLDPNIWVLSLSIVLTFGGTTVVPTLDSSSSSSSGQFPQFYLAPTLRGISVLASAATRSALEPLVYTPVRPSRTLFCFVCSSGVPDSELEDSICFEAGSCTILYRRCLAWAHCSVNIQYSIESWLVLIKQVPTRTTASVVDRSPSSTY